MKDYSISRRDMLARTTAGLAALGLPAWAEKQAVAAEQERIADLPRKIGPNDTLNIACIGAGGKKGGFRQGLGDTRGISRQPGVKVLAIADVDQTHADDAAKSFGPDCQAYKDFREVLARKDIDAVVIGTPDHWHAIIAIAAMKAGKDVYCEKPLTLTIDEGKHLVKMQKKTGRVFQVGSQQRSDQRFRTACELVRNGRIGKLKTVYAQIPNGSKGGPFPVKEVPADFDWDFWLGPAPVTPYIYERTHGSFRYWYEYSGGMVTDWGAHHNDIAQWGMGKDSSGPIRIESVGMLPAMWNGYNTAMDFEITYTYPEDVKLICTSKGENGVKFEGENGWIFVSRSRIEGSEERILKDPLDSNAVKLYVSNNHHANFIDGVRNRKACICPAEVGHRSVSVCHLGNISLRLGGRRLEWDPEKEEFKNDDEANEMLSRPIRGNWKLT